jgi:hypothetical protein
LIDKLKNEKGQALFEMIIFLPFLMFMYMIFYTVGNSISGSINQQKAVRSYFYRLVKGNSYIVPAIDLTTFANEGHKQVGFYAIGWKEKLDGKVPVANCFKFSSMLKNGSTEECDSNKRDQSGSSRYVRIFTMYGVCGPIFSMTSPTTTGKKYILDQATQTYGPVINGVATASQDLCSLQ